MKTKITYVSTKPVFLADARGNIKELPVGSEITPAQWAALKSDTARAKFVRTEKSVGRVRFSGGVVTDLPVVDGVVKTSFAPGEFHLLPLAVRDLVNEVAELWPAACPEIPFPGVGVSPYDGGDGHLAWWINGQGLPATATPMLTTSNHMCGRTSKRSLAAGGYPWRTASLLKVAERLRGGRPVFATAEQAIDRALAL